MEDRTLRLTEYQRLIMAFVSHYGQCINCAYTDFKWPDLTERNRMECDCVASNTNSSNLLAIELTEAETYKGKKEYEKLFLQYFQNREKELTIPRGYFAQILLPEHLLRKKKTFDWQQVSDAMKSFVEQDLPKLPDGSHQIDDADGIPFWFRVWKKSSDHPAIFFVNGYAPEFIEEGLIRTIQKALLDNVGKFATYPGNSYCRILLIESQDFLTMNEQKLQQSYQVAATRCNTKIYDEVWLCWTWPLDNDMRYQFYRVKKAEVRQTGGALKC